MYKVQLLNAVDFIILLNMSQKSLMLKEKIKILDKVKTFPKSSSQRKLSCQLNIPRASLQQSLKNEIKLCEEAESMNKCDNEYKVKQKKTGKDCEVEEALLKWFEKARANNIPVSGPILTEKAG